MGAIILSKNNRFRIPMPGIMENQIWGICWLEAPSIYSSHSFAPKWGCSIISQIMRNITGIHIVPMSIQFQNSVAYLFWNCYCDKGFTEKTNHGNQNSFKDRMLIEYTLIRRCLYTPFPSPSELWFFSMFFLTFVMLAFGSQYTLW